MIYCYLGIGMTPGDFRVIQSIPSLGHDIRPLVDWCDENPSIGHYTYLRHADDTTWRFEKEEDALLFRLKWI